MIIGMLGGMTGPIVAPAATSDPAYPGSYPRLTIAGIRITPSAATTAGPEPEIAAKIMHATIVDAPSPPGVLPVIASPTLMISSASPERDISVPTSIKNGIAMSGNESAVLIIAWARSWIIGLPGKKNQKTNAHADAIAIATGTERSSRTNRETSNSVIMLLSPPLRRSLRATPERDAESSGT